MWGIQNIFWYDKTYFTVKFTVFFFKTILAFFPFFFLFFNHPFTVIFFFCYTFFWHNNQQKFISWVISANWVHHSNWNLNGILYYNFYIFHISKISPPPKNNNNRLGSFELLNFVFIIYWRISHICKWYTYINFVYS